jgi:translation initiation factor 4G
MQPPPFTPNQNTAPQFGLSVAASSFTPRPSASKAIKFTRPDGTALDIKEAAAALKGPTTSGSPIPEASSDSTEPPKKKVPSLPVVVRLESEDQKKERLRDEERQARIKKEEEKEEVERKERKDRKAREEQEKLAKDKAEADVCASLILS